MSKSGPARPGRLRRRLAPATTNVGFVLPAALFAITLLAVITFVLGYQGASQTRSVVGEFESDRLRYVAEAGLNHARWAADGNACSNYKLADTPFGADRYSASFSPAAGSPVTIAATGTLENGLSRTLTYPDTPIHAKPEIALLQPGPALMHDAYISAVQPDRSYGADKVLHVDADGWRTLLRFELAPLPRGSKVVSATLQLRSDNIDGAGHVDAHRLTDGWVEGTGIGSPGVGVSWNERDAGEPWAVAGGAYDPAVAATSYVQEPSGAWHLWDVTGLVDAWLNRGVLNNGLMLVARPGQIEARFHSSDSDDPLLRPKLTITYACECGAVCKPAEISGTYCDADFEPEIKDFQFKWMSGTDTLIGIDFLPAGTTVDGIEIPADGGWIMTDSGKDDFFVTDIDGNTLTRFPVGQNDARGVAYVRGGSWVDHLAFAEKRDDAIYFTDLDGAIQGSISTTLTAQEPLGLTFIRDPQDDNYDDHLAFTSTKNGGGAIYIVDQAGVLKHTIDVDSYAVEPNGLAHLAGSDKFLVLDKDGLASIIDFDGNVLNQYSTETWAFEEMHGATIHPVTCKHVVVNKNRTKVAGLATLELGGAGSPRVLLIVANENSLTAEEDAKKTLFESWGHTVSVISDNANSVAYEAAIANNDVVFVGEDASSGQVGTKLVDAPIGVVAEEPNLSDEFGLSTTIDWSSGSTLNIDDNGHFITKPFAAGPLQILNASSSLADLAGTSAPDLRVLGSTGAGPMLATLDASAERFDALPSSGRRVQVPWGGTNFQLSSLTDDGRTVLRRSLEWGIQPPPRCDADFVANDPVSEFPWMPGTGDIHGIDYLPEGLVVNSVSVPAGGGWIMSDTNKDRLFVTDLAGNPLTDFPVFPADAQGVALIDAGPWFHHLAVPDKSRNRLYYLDLSGSIVWSFRLNGITESALGLGFVGSTASVDYDNHLAISSDKNPSGGGTATIYIVDQWGVLKKTIDVEAYAPTPLAVTHVDGADKLIVADKDGVVSVVDFDGKLLHQYPASNYAITQIREVAVNPMTCEHVFVDKDFEKIASLQRIVSSGPGYGEMHRPWVATTPDTWETINLDVYGVPPNSVAEVAVVNEDGGTEQWAGVRTAGSSLERRLQLHEAAGGGGDVMVMHVQTDSTGHIEYYADDEAKVVFVLLGYWTGASYVENWQPFKAGDDGSWRDHALGAYGVSPNQVAEILMVNNAGFNDREAGVRTNGSSLDRRIKLHEALDGGDDAMSMMTVAGSDSGATIEVYARKDADIDFYLLGHWSTPPGTYTSAFADLGTADTTKAWEDLDLSGEGVPAHAVAQIAAINSEQFKEAMLGVRFRGSYLTRLLDVHQALNGGDDVATMHVNVDADGLIQAYDEDVLLAHAFYLLGWWVLP